MVVVVIFFISSHIIFFIRQRAELLLMGKAGCYWVFFGTLFVEQTRLWLIWRKKCQYFSFSGSGYVSLWQNCVWHLSGLWQNWVLGAMYSCLRFSVVVSTPIMQPHLTWWRSEQTVKFGDSVLIRWLRCGINTSKLSVSKGTIVMVNVHLNKLNEVKLVSSRRAKMTAMIPSDTDNLIHADLHYQSAL